MEEYNECPACKNEVQTSLEFCHICEFPFNGTEKEKSIHIGRFISEKGIIIDADTTLKKSQQLLMAVIGFFLLGMLLNFDALLRNPFALLLNSAIVLVITASAVLIKKAPLLFTIIPLVILLLLYISNYLIDPRTLMQGIIFKVIILGSLIYSIYMHISSERFKKKYNIAERE